MKEIIKRDHWNNRELKYLMQFFNTPEAMVVIYNLIKKHDDLNEKRIITIASRTRYFTDYSKYILNNPEKFNIDSICLAIRNIKDIDDFKLIEKFKKESNWIYHVNIIHAIMNNHFFSKNNLDYLLTCLHSNHWWLRHRSAQAIIQYYGSDEKLIHFLLQTINDNFAKDSLQVSLNKYQIALNQGG